MYSLSGGLVHFLPPVTVIQDCPELRSGTGGIWRAYAGEGIEPDVVRQRFVYGRPELAHMMAKIPTHEDEGVWISGDACKSSHVADSVSGHGEEVVGPSAKYSWAWKSPIVRWPVEFGWNEISRSSRPA